MADGDLIMFFGIECVHCHRMDPLVERLEEELNIKITRLEVWHNDQNARIQQQLDKGFCGGVPFFYNKKTGKWICGETTYENLRKWALGK